MSKYGLINKGRFSKRQETSEEIVVHNQYVTLFILKLSGVSVTETLVTKHKHLVTFEIS